METTSQCISQVVLPDPDDTLDVIIYELYADGSITKHTEGSWSIYDHEILSKDELSPGLKTMLLQNTSNDFKNIASKYLEDQSK